MVMLSNILAVCILFPGKGLGLGFSLSERALPLVRLLVLRGLVGFFLRINTRFLLCPFVLNDSADSFDVKIRGF